MACRAPYRSPGSLLAVAAYYAGNFTYRCRAGAGGGINTNTFNGAKCGENIQNRAVDNSTFPRKVRLDQLMRRRAAHMRNKANPAALGEMPPTG